MKYWIIVWILILALIFLWLRAWFAIQAEAQVITMTAEVPDRHQTWAQENCIEGQRVCYKLTPSWKENKVDSEMLDLDTGDFMSTWWLNDTTMARNIEGPNGFRCDIMFEQGGEIVEQPCELEVLSKLILVV